MGMSMTEVRLRKGTVADASACAAIFNDWVDATGWMVRVHDRADVERHYREVVAAECDVTVAEMAGRVAGFLARKSDWIEQFYVRAEARGAGIGAALLDGAKAGRARLCLWTFAANSGAQRFYARHGFSEVGGTAGENEEGLADVRLEWVRAA